MSSKLAVVFKGFELSNNSVSPQTKVDISFGVAENASETSMKAESNSVFTKDIAAAWAAGSGNGGLFSGSVAANTTYHVFALFNSGSSSMEFGFDTDVGGANRPVAWNLALRIGSVITDANSHVRAFHQHGDEFVLDTSVKDVDVTNPGTSAVLRSLTVPTGLSVAAVFTSVSYDGSQYTAHYCSSPDSVDETPLYSNAIESAASDIACEAVAQNRIWTNTSGQVRTRLQQSGAGTALKIRTRGWIDNLNGTTTSGF